MPKRRILLVAQAWMVIPALTLLTLTATGAVELWMVYLLVLARGLGHAVDNPVRRRQILDEALGHIAKQLELVRRRRDEIAGLEGELVAQRRRVRDRLRELERDAPGPTREPHVALAARARRRRRSPREGRLPSSS